MRLETPPSRYRIVEKDGRLIVTDTVTGTRNASADLPTMADIARGSGTAPPPPSATSATPVVAPERSTPRTKRQAGTPPAGVNQGKLALLVLIAVATIAVLMLTWLWVPLAIALFVPQVRELLKQTVGGAIKRWFAA